MYHSIAWTYSANITNLKVKPIIWKQQILQTGSSNFIPERNLCTIESLFQTKTQSPEVVLKRVVLKTLTKLTGKHLYRVSFLIQKDLIKTVLKRDSGTGVFMWILQNF